VPTRHHRVTHSSKEGQDARPRLRPTPPHSHFIPSFHAAQGHALKAVDLHLVRLDDLVVDEKVACC
jgi:hypothetical protein